MFGLMTAERADQAIIVTTGNFTRDARRNDGSPKTFGEGERMDDFKVFVGQPAQAATLAAVRIAGSTWATSVTTVPRERTTS